MYKWVLKWNKMGKNILAKYTLKWESTKSFGGQYAISKTSTTRTFGQFGKYH